jgi:hydroxymethylbilane synthase
MKIRIGTRGSELAMWQARYVAERLGADKTEIVIIKTHGDRIQNVSFDKMEGKGFFTKEIEDALTNGEIDIAVHSLKDLPTENPAGLVIAAIPVREDPADMLLVRKDSVAPSAPLPLAEGAVVGTSSIRRLAQLSCARSGLNIQALRGNVTTRLSRLREGAFDAIVLAAAGLKRLEPDLSGLLVQRISFDVFLPAPGQGALALQTREDDASSRAAALPLNDDDTSRAVRAERAFLSCFGGGCHIPLGALATVRGADITLDGLIAAPDGSAIYRASVTDADPVAAGEALAAILIEKGAKTII